MQDLPNLGALLRQPEPLNVVKRTPKHGRVVHRQGRNAVYTRSVLSHVLVLIYVADHEALVVAGR